MRIKFLILLLIVGNHCFSQNIKITVKSDDEKELLSDVLIYSKNKLIGKTSGKGEVFLDANSADTIQVVKEDYSDLTIATNVLPSLIFLKKLEVISLNEVVISKLNAEDVVDRVEERLINHIGFYTNSKTVQYLNILTTGKDTLHYLNNRMKFIPYDGNYINEQNRIIKNFYFERDELIYKIGNKRVKFATYFTTKWPFIASKDGFLKVLKSKDDYDFELIATGEYYKINYKAKQKKKFSYNGYLIVDREDFGIYELEMKLSPHSSNIGVTYLFTEKQNLSYSINEDNVFYSMSKIDNQYVLNWARFNFTATHTKGDFKDEKFICKLRVEATPDFLDDKMYKFDFMSYEKF
jgi:hypothetical protein